MAKGNRGGTSGGGTGGVDANNIVATRSLISERERFGTEVDEALSVLRDIEDEYNVSVEDMQVATIKDKGGTTLGYYDWDGNIAINEKMFANATQLNALYDNSVQSGFHPARGKKTGLQAVMAHELGHRLNYVAGGGTWDRLDSSAREIVERASRATGNGRNVAQFRSKISGYAKESNAEAVAEAFADVYLNGTKAKSESRAVYNELRRMLGR